MEQKKGFLDTWTAVSLREPVTTMTTTGKQFDTLAITARDGRKAIVFKRNGVESARAYECCWGHYCNCYGTRFGMYAKALDDVL